MIKNAKIYKVSWFDEDEYGPMRMLYYIVQANNPEEALGIAKMHAMNEQGIKEDELGKYEEIEVIDITDEKILMVGFGTFA
jgi:hypothetical protein